jgi:arylsulfatase A-like enzyme
MRVRPLFGCVLERSLVATRGRIEYRVRRALKPWQASDSIGGRIALFVLTQGAAAGFIAIAEAACVRGASALAVVFAGGFGAAFGAAAGFVMGMTVAALGWSPRLGRVAFGLYAFAGALVLADEMGIISALWGRAVPLAVFALAATLASIAALAALLFGFARRTPAALGWLEKADLRFSCGSLFALALLALYCGRTVVPPYYRAVQNVTACASSVLCGLGLQCAVARRVPPRWVVVVASGAWSILALLPAFLLDASRAAERSALDSMRLARVGLSLETYLTDVDRDGYTSLFGGGDCAPRDGRVHPGAKEIPGNGLDDNCLFGDAPPPRRDWKEAPVPDSSLPRSPVNVVLLTIDTVRRDRVGLYGARPSPTPHLDSFASTALVFDRAYTASTRTCSSLPALHYGLYPLELRWKSPLESEAIQRMHRRVLIASPSTTARCVVDEVGPHRAMPLAWYLKARGMVTAAVVDDNYSFLIQRELFDEGFDSFEDTPHHTDDELVPVAVDTLHRLEMGARPFFLWVHLFGPHERGLPAASRDIPNDYDAQLARTDAALPPLLEALEASGRHSPLVIAVASDHGELFGPHSRGHGTDLSEEQLRIPLFVRAPGLRPGRTGQLVSTVDIMPTLLAATRTPRPSSRDFVDLAAPDEVRRPRILFSDVWVPDFGIACTAAYDGSQKLTYFHRLRTFELSPQTGSVVDRSRMLRGAIDRYLAENEANFSDYPGLL